MLDNLRCLGAACCHGDGIFAISIMKLIVMLCHSSLPPSLAPSQSSLSPIFPPSLPLFFSQSLSNASRDEAGIKLLHEYYNQLQLVAKRFIHPSMKHGLAFIWYVRVHLTGSLIPNLHSQAFIML